MRIRIVRVHWDVFMGMMHGHPFEEVVSDMPSDASITNVVVDYKGREVRFTVQSVLFDDVPDDKFAPEWEPTLTVKDTEYAAVLRAISRHPLTPDKGGP
jgi:hypothetical protein